MGEKYEKLWGKNMGDYGAETWGFTALKHGYYRTETQGFTEKKHIASKGRNSEVRGTGKGEYRTETKQSSCHRNKEIMEQKHIAS